MFFVMLWHLVLVGWLAASVQAFAPTSIRLAELSGRSFSLVPRSPPSTATAPEVLLWEKRDSAPPNGFPVLSPHPDGTITWESARSEQFRWCLEASGENDAIHIDRCTGEATQLWDFPLPARGRKSQIRLKGTKTCIGISDEGEKIDAALQMRNCEDEATHLWRFEDPPLLPTQGFTSSSSVRHVVASFLFAAALAALSVGSWLWRRQAARVLAASRDHSGVCLSPALVTSQDKMPLSPGLHSNEQSMVPAAMALNPFAAIGEALGIGKALPGRPEKMRVRPTHYVLGNPMEGPWPENMKKVVFANGCFWGSEKGIWRLPGGGIHSTAVGYAAGVTPNPTYNEACSGGTGSTEAVQVVYDPEKISLVDILRWFWEAHDPTQGNRQGNDRGTQYRSGLYYFDEEQKELFEASREAYEKALAQAGKGGFFSSGKITTQVAAASDYDEVFYYAEDYHQQYLAKPGARPYCSAQPQEVSLPPYEEWVPKSWSPDLVAKYAPKLPEAFWKQHAPGPGCVICAPNEPIVFPKPSGFP